MDTSISRSNQPYIRQIDQNGGERSPKSEKKSEPESVEEKEHQRFIFDSVCSHFQCQVFVEQLLAHLCIVFVPAFTNMYGQGFTTVTFGSILFNWVVPVSLYIMMIIYFASNPADFGSVYGAVWLPIIFFVQHRLTVALKYASMSTSEYRKFMACTDDTLLSRYAGQMQLLGFWNSRDEDLLAFELGSAAVRIAAKINEIFFVLHDPTVGESERNDLRHWNVFISGNANAGDGWHEKFVLRPDGNYAISVFDTCVRMISTCDCEPRYRRVLQYITLTFTFVNALVPFLLLAQGHFEFTVVTIVFLIIATVLNFILGTVTSLLMTVGVFDAIRQVNMVQCLHAMTRMTDLRVDSQFSLFTPFLHSKNNPHYERDAKLSFDNFHLIKSLTKRRNGAVYYDANPLLHSVQVLHATDSQVELPSLSHANSANDYNNGLPFPLERQSINNSNSGKRGKKHQVLGEYVLHQRRVSLTTKEELLLSDNNSRKHRIDPSYVKAEDYVDALTSYYAARPRIDLDLPENVTSWTYCRLAVQNFGERFRMRTEVYTVGNAFILLGLMISTLIIVITANNKKEAFHSCFVIQACLSIAVNFLFLTLLATCLAYANSQLALHNRTLSAHALRMQHEIIQLKTHERHLKDLYSWSETSKEHNPDSLLEIKSIQVSTENIEEAVRCVEAAMSIVELNTQLKPLQIFGFTADSSVVYSIMTTCLSFFLVLGSLYSASVASADSAII